MKFKNIIGGSEKDAYNKFPWLRKAKIIDATIDITEDYLIWEDGVWKGGVWEDGVWKGGVWKGGVWEGGFMWSNLRQEYIQTIQKKGKFIKKKAGKL